MTETQKAAMQAALDAFQVATTPLAKDRQEVLAAIKALRAAFAEPVGEPVAYRSLLASGSYTYCITNCFFDNAEPLYTAPQTQQPAVVPLLTDDESYVLYEQAMQGYFTDAKHNWATGRASVFARAIEAAVRQKAGLK